MVSEICLSKEAQDKRQRVATLLSELSELYEKREFMSTYERNDLTALYAELIGSLQYEEFVLKFEVQKLKRTSELIQAKRNRGEEVVMSVIEQIVENELAEEQRQLQLKLEKLIQAREILKAPVMAEDDAIELKSIYRILMKRLHPDWNPEQTEQERELFIRAKSAYRACDLQELRNILVMCDKKDILENTSMDTIDEQIKRLEKCKSDLEERIYELNHTFPFNYRERLQDKEWVEEEQARIQKRIDVLSEERKTWGVYLFAQINPNQIPQA